MQSNSSSATKTTDKKLTGKVFEIAVFAMLAALLYAVQVGMAALPNIELVSLLVIVYTLVYGWKALIPVYVFVFLEWFTYGFGTWWFSYLYVWAILVCITMIFRKVDEPILWAVISAVYGLFFGMLTAIPHFFIGGFGYGVSYWLGGITFDLLHCGGNFVAAALLVKPLRCALSAAQRAVKHK